MRPLEIYIGYDKAEPVAYHTCAESIITNSSVPVRITPLWLPQLANVFHNPKHKDGYPPSNGFIFSRFLVPYLNRFNGLAMFVDGDMVIEGDVAELFAKFDPYHAVEVVKHDYQTTAPTKYLGAVNEDYPRKNWSSVIMWNCSHYANARLTPEFVQGATGEFLHRFQWLDDTRIGEIPKSWNVLADEPNQDRESNPKLVHYTIGTPCWEEYANCEYSDLWHKHHEAVNSFLVKG